MKIHFQKLLISFVTLSLAACSGMTKLECPNKAGTMCKSLGQINAMVDKGDLQEVDGKNYKEAQLEKSEFNTFSNSEMISSNSPLRSGETIQRVWIAPYEDTADNYHQGNLIYTVTKNSHWINTHSVKQTKI